MKFAQFAALGAVALLINNVEAIRLRTKEETDDTEVEVAVDATVAQTADETTAAPANDAAVATDSTTEAKIGIDILEKGQGELCQTGQTATVQYTGALAQTGTVFDSSLETGAPIQFQIGNFNVIQCWE